MKMSSFVLCCLVFAVGLLLPGHGFAQQQQSQPKPKAPGREYRLEVKYTSGIAQNYEFTETSTIKRIHSDSSTKTFNRNVKYFITVRCIESLDGISKVVVTVDSMTYAYESNGTMVVYDSQVDNTPKNFSDLHHYVALLNRPVTFTMNSYGEVTKIEGDQIEFWRDYITENAADLDSLTLLLWNVSLSDENIKFVCDLQKGAIPGLKVAVDSSWTHSYLLCQNGLTINHPVKSVFSENNGGYYTITTSDSLNIPPQPYRPFGIAQVAQVNNGTVSFTAETILKNTGVIDELHLKSLARYKVSIMNELYTEVVNSDYLWKLTGQFQW